MCSDSKRFDTIIRNNKVLSGLIAHPVMCQESFDQVHLGINYTV